MTHEEQINYIDRIRRYKLLPSFELWANLSVEILTITEAVEEEGHKIDRKWLEEQLTWCRRKNHKHRADMVHLR